MNNLNYNPEKLEEFAEEERISRYENGNQRMLVDMRIRDAADPSYRVSPEIVEEDVDMPEEDE